MRLLLAMLCIIGERDEVLHDFPRFVANRADEQRGPKTRSVLAPVTYLGLTVGMASECSFDLRLRVRSGAASHQRFEACAEDLLTVEPGQSEEGIVGENDRVLGLQRVGEKHRHASLFGRDHEWAKLIPKSLDIRFGALLIRRSIPIA